MRKRTDADAGFSLVEVLIAVLILGVTGLALLDGLQSNVLQVQRVDARANAAVTLTSAVQSINASPYVSCQTSPAPYSASALQALGFRVPSGMVVSVQEFITTATTPWQDCAAVYAAGTRGAAQVVTLSDASGATRTMMRFDGATPTTSPTPPAVQISAVVSTDPRSTCDIFSKSSANRPCTITVTNTGGTGTTWHIEAVTFAGGSFTNPAPTAAIAQGSPITINTYTLDSGSACPSKTSPLMSIVIVDDGNGSTTTLYPVLTC